MVVCIMTGLLGISFVEINYLRMDIFHDTEDLADEEDVEMKFTE